MRRRKLFITLTAAAAFGLPAVPASAEPHRISVTLLTGQTLTITIDVPPGYSLESIEIPDLPAPIQSIADLGFVATPTPEPAPGPVDTRTIGGEAATRPAMRYLRPFPVVRIRGSLAADGANVTLLRVTAPSGATVIVRCTGDGCPLRRLKTKSGRIRAFERFLAANVRMTIRVRLGEYIGKYVRLRIRAGKPPARRDACLLPGSRGPDTCPAV